MDKESMKEIVGQLIYDAIQKIKHPYLYQQKPDKATLF